MSPVLTTMDFVLWGTFFFVSILTFVCFLVHNEGKLHKVLYKRKLHTMHMWNSCFHLWNIMFHLWIIMHFFILNVKKPCAYMRFLCLMWHCCFYMWWHFTCKNIQISKNHMSKCEISHVINTHFCKHPFPTLVTCKLSVKLAFPCS